MFKARFKRHILQLSNLMQMKKIYCFRSFALDSAHLKCDVKNGPKEITDIAFKIFLSLFQTKVFVYLFANQDMKFIKPTETKHRQLIYQWIICLTKSL